MKFLKRLVRRILGEHATGIVDYFRFAGRASEFDGPFNEQPLRQAMFRALVARLSPCAIVETGTYKGASTAFMADVGVPTYTVEANPRHFAFAKMRLRGRSNVSMVYGDSRLALRSWLRGELRRFANDTVFFYLDAHWHEDLPLAEELALVFQHCPKAIVMIDDFRVPHDERYGYDAYGTDKELRLSYIQDVVAGFELCVLYPSAPAASEGGARRGAVVLARACIHGSVLASLPHLRLA